MKNDFIPWIYPRVNPLLKNFMFMYGKKAVYKRNEMFINPQTGKPQILYLLEGTALLSYSNQEGKMMSASFILPGAVLGEFTLLNSSIKIFDIITATKCTVLEVPPSVLREGVMKNSELKSALFDYIIIKQYSAIIGFIYNNTFPIKYRLLALFMGFAKFFNEKIKDGEWGEIPIRISQENLARTINCSRNTANAIITELMGDGILKFHNNCSMILYNSSFIAKPSITINTKATVFSDNKSEMTSAEKYLIDTPWGTKDILEVSDSVFRKK